ncbi:MAG TPA: hypothetical protein VG326_08715 [Tepidisphaeraceae bacterium]|nr:hypothetical protein [Tepidisphaeraceae bacterium]
MPVSEKAPPKPSAVAGPLEFKQSSTLEHDRELVSARFSLCGKYLFAGSYDSNVYRWDIKTGTKTEFFFHHGWIQGLAFHPDRKRFFTGDSWGGLCAWNYADERPKPLWKKSDAHARWMRAMAISPDGAQLATCGADRIIKLWSTSDGAAKWESAVQDDDLHSLQFHPTGDALLVGDLKGIITHWDLATRAPVRRLDARILYLRPVISGVPEINDVGGVRCIAVDHDGKNIACCGSQPVSSGFFTGKPTIVVIDWETGKQKKTLQWENADPSEGVALDVAWHADGFLMAASSGQPGKGAVYFWKPGEKSPFYIEKKLAHSRSVSLSADGDRLAFLQVAPSSGQGGNGRHLAEGDEYLGFNSVIRVFESSKV